MIETRTHAHTRARRHTHTHTSTSKKPQGRETALGQFLGTESRFTIKCTENLRFATNNDVESHDAGRTCHPPRHLS